MFLIRARRGLGLTAHRGWARLLIDHMDTQVQRPEFPQAPEPAWGSTKASAQDYKAVDAHHYHYPPSGFNAGIAMGALFLCWLNPPPGVLCFPRYNVSWPSPMIGCPSARNPGTRMWWDLAF